MRILLVCERSGGHIFPALTFAQKYLQANDQQSAADIHFFATATFLNEYITKEGFKVCGRSFKTRNIVWEIVWRFWEAIWILFFIRPNKVVGFGGRDSFFLVFFSWILRIDTAIYEPNRTFGKANKVLARFVRSVYCGFPQADLKKAIEVGIPLRQTITLIPRKQALTELGLNDEPTVLCFGGSQGSVFLNQQMVKLAKQCSQPFQVIHLCGTQYLEKIQQQYKDCVRKVFLRDFYSRMQVLFSAADLVICRSGANTVAEVSFFKVPVIFIPHPLAGGHQNDNAAYFVEKNAGEVFYDRSLDFEKFKQTALDLLFDQTKRNQVLRGMDQINIGVEFQRFGKNISWK